MKKQFIILLSLLTLSTLTYAKQQKARVIDVKPVYDYVFIKKPVEHCASIVRNEISNNYHGAVMGSIVGSTIAHMTSERKNQAQATIIGAIIGGAIGSQLDKSKRYYSHSPSHVCARHNIRAERVRVISGYDYWYRVNGKLYQSFSKTEPNRYVSLRK